MTLNEREVFESIKEIQDCIKREQLIFNTKLGCYTKKSGKMCVSANWTNGAWFIFERNAKAQAVPDTHVIVPKEPNDEIIASMKLTWWESDCAHIMKTSVAKSIYAGILKVSESGAEG